MPSSIVGQMELARELRVTPRRLRQLEDEGVVISISRGRYNREEAVARYRLYRDRDDATFDAFCDQVVRRAVEAEHAVDSLDPDRPDAILRAREAAAVLTALGQDLHLLLAIEPVHSRSFHRQALDDLLVMPALTRCVSVVQEHVARHGLSAEFAELLRSDANLPSGDPEDELNDLTM